MNKKSIHFALPIILIFTIISGCSKDPATTPSSSKKPNSNTSWGEIITIPNINSADGDGASELKTSNEGVYMRVYKASPDKYWIYRMQNGGSWTYHEEPSLYFDWEPSNENTESPDDFAIFFSTIDKNGFVNINTGLPALMEENHEPNFNALSEILVDNSSGGYKWAFFGDGVGVQDNTNIGNYPRICSFPTSGDIIFAEADPNDAVIWAASSTKLYKITVNGAVTAFDVSAHDDASMLFHSIEKIRFSYDPLHNDVYFRFQNKVFKIKDGTTLSLFYTIDNGSNYLGGDFCIDNSYMYATDGTKKSLGLGTETSFIPEQPQTSDQTILLDYITKKAAMELGPIEVSKDPLDNYIYSIYSADQLIKVPKSF